MNCSHESCTYKVKFRCACQELFWCDVHFGNHLATIGNHDFENLVPITLQDPRLTDLNSDILKRLKKIEDAKNSLNSISTSLIKTIKSLHKQAIQNLDAISKQCTRLLHRKEFFEFEMPTIENIETMEIALEAIDENAIKKEIRKNYSQDFISYMEKLEYRRLQFLSQHSGGFWCGAVTANGETLVTGGYDSIIRVWDLNEKKQKFILAGHYSVIRSIALAEDFNSIISGSYDNTVRIWNLVNKKQVVLLEGHKDPVYAVCFVSKNSLIASGDYSGKLIIWSFTDYTILKRLQLSFICCLYLKNDQSSLLIGSSKDIIFCELETVNISATFKGHNGAVWCIALTRDEQIMVSGSSDNSIFIWDLKKSQSIFKLKSQKSQIKAKLSGHTGAIKSLVLTSDDKFIISGSDDCTVRVWSMLTGDQEKQFKEHSNFVHGILKANDAFLTISADSKIGKLDNAMSKLQANWFIRPYESNFVNYSQDSRFVGYGSRNEACVWDLQNEKDRNILIGHNGLVQFVEISRDGQWAISGSRSSKRNLILWNLNSGQEVGELKGHLESVFCACFTKDALMAASGSFDQTIRTWDLRNFKEGLKLKLNTSHVYSIKFIENKNLLVSIGEAEKLMIWSLRDGSQYAVLSGHNQCIWKIIVTDDEKFIVSGDLFDGIRVWDVEEKRQVSKFKYDDEAARFLNQVPMFLLKSFLKVS